MKKSVATIEGLDQKFETKFELMDQKFDLKFEQMDRKFDVKFDRMDQKFGRILEQIQGSIQVLAKKVDENTSSIDDIIENTQYLMGSAVTQDDVRQIVHDEITPVTSELHSAMDVIMGKHQTFEGEVLAVQYNNEQLYKRVGIIEQTIGLPNAA